MGLFEHFPYTNFHELNLDWIIGKVRESLDNSKKANEAAANAENSVNNFINNLDLTTEINTKIDELVADGTLQQLVDNKKNFKNAKMIFIGDSYGPYSEWPRQTGELLGCTWYDQTISGASFLTGYSTGLDNFIAQNPGKAEEITDILVGGGINDSDHTHVQTLSANITTFMQKCKATFPNAKVWFAYFGYAKSKSPILAGREWPYRLLALNEYSNAKKYGATYLCGLENVLHNEELLNADLLHPNLAGGAAIAAGIANALESGSALVCYPSRDATISAEHTGYFQHWIVGNELTLRCYALSFSNLSVEFSGGSYSKICDANFQYVDTFENLQVTISYRDKDLVPRNGNFVLFYDGSALYIACHEVDETGYFLSGSIKSINIISLTATLSAFTS